MATEGQCDKTASDMEVWMKKRCVTEFYHAEKTAPTDIHQPLLDVSGDNPVDVSTVRWWLVRFSSGNSGSLPLVQIFASTVCKLLYITGKNAELMAVTALRKRIL